ncbi:MAG: hypothetical protein JW715_17185 [Sedimentisphaerales bacterium]|nr:hypothetical protein [Sedimentisphaerales bacterium]
MKSKKIKLSKMAVVVFLTALIWIWADLALDEEFQIPRITINMGRSRPTVWVSFGGETSVDVNNIRLKGPASKIRIAKQVISNDPQKLEFTLDAEQYGITKSGKLEVPDFLKKTDWIQELNLKVESCEPNIVDVNFVELVPRDLEVRCFYEADGRACTPESIVPDKISMYVPSSWMGESLVARVVLTRADIDSARSLGVVKKPFIELATGQPYRYAEKSVRIKMSPEEDLREVRNVENPTLGICDSYSLNMQGRYKVEVLNLADVLNITVRATPAALKAYEDKWFKVILEIKDSDINTEGGQEVQRRVVSYNFPDEYIKSGEIELVGEKAEAQFKLIKLPSADNL